MEGAVDSEVQTTMAALVANIVAMLDMSKPPKGDKFGLPPPPVPHLTLDDTALRGRAVFVIGDVHGCLEELKELVKQARQLEPNIVFLFVGDLVNRGPYSKEVLRYVRGGEIECYSVRGNHEEIAMNQYRLLQTDPGHVVRSKHAWIKDISAQDYDYMAQLPFSISVPSLNSIIVHAGLVPGIPLQQQSLLSLNRIRNIVQEDYFEAGGLRFTSKVTEGVPWSSLWPGPEHVYYGHDARRGFQEREFATCLDTGCQYGLCLTGMFINGCRKTLTVKAKKVYCVGKPE